MQDTVRSGLEKLAHNLSKTEIAHSAAGLDEIKHVYQKQHL